MTRDWMSELNWIPPLDPTKETEEIDPEVEPQTLVLPVFPLGSTAYMPHSDHIAPFVSRPSLEPKTQCQSWTCLRRYPPDVPSDHRRSPFAGVIFIDWFWFDLERR